MIHKNFQTETVKKIYCLSYLSWYLTQCREARIKNTHFCAYFQETNMTDKLKQYELSEKKSPLKIQA